MVYVIRGRSGVGGFQGVTGSCFYLFTLAVLLVLFANYGQCSEFSLFFECENYGEFGFTKIIN